MNHLNPLWFLVIPVSKGSTCFMHVIDWHQILRMISEHLQLRPNNKYRNCKVSHIMIVKLVNTAAAAAAAAAAAVVLVDSMTLDA
jgi:hypothetical protein